MAQADTPPLEESALDLALANAQKTYDPDKGETDETDEDENEDLMGGHPAEDDEDEENETPTVPPEKPAGSAPGSTPSPTPTPTEVPQPNPAEQRLYLALEENQVLREQMARHQRELDELKKKAEPPAPPAPQTPTRTAPDVQGARQTLAQKVREAVTQDNTVPDYWDRVGNAYADGMDPLIEARVSEVMKSLTGEQRATLRQELAKDPEFVNTLKSSLKNEIKAEIQQEQDNTRIFEHIVDKAKEAGFEVGGKTEDADFFWDTAMAYADKTLPQGSVEARTESAITFMRTFKGGQPPPASNGAGASPAEPKPRAVRQPMTRQSAGPAAAGARQEATEQPASLDDAINYMHGRNRA